MPADRLGLRVVMTSAIQHYLMGISISEIIDMLKSEHGFEASRGGLTRAWRRLALTMVPEQARILAAAVKDSAVLHKDETGWRVNGRRRS